MGKGSNDLWDDSALIDAFDVAMSKYKYQAMHGASYRDKASKKEDGDDTVVEPGPVGGTHGTTQYKDSADFVQDITAAPSASCSNDSASNRDGETQEIGISLESHPFEQSPAAPSINEKTERYSDPQNEEYNRLLTSYYEIEAERQKILQQLQQTSIGNYQWPSQGSTTEVNSAPAYNSTYPGMPPTLHSSQCHSSCLGSSHASSYNFPGCYCHCMFGNTGSIASHVQHIPAAFSTHGLPVAEEGSLKKVISSAILKNSSISNSIEGKEKEIGEAVGGQGHPALANSSNETDLSDVLGAWYSAGFYTGRYLLEQSLKKGAR